MFFVQAHRPADVCFLQFVQRYISTIGVDFGVKPIMMKDLEVKVNFWDLSGHPEFFEVRNEFYKDSQGVKQPTKGNKPHKLMRGMC